MKVRSLFFSDKKRKFYKHHNSYMHSMEVTLEELTERPSQKEAELILRNYQELCERVGNVEDGYRCTLPEFANALGYLRWKAPRHREGFISEPDGKLCNLLTENSLNDYPRPVDDGKNHLLRQGLNNPYISWPAFFGIFGAVRSAGDEKDSSGHIRTIEFLREHYPGVRLKNLDNRLLARLTSYKDCDSHEKEIRRGLIWGIEGELFQNSLGLSEPQELRGFIFGLKAFEDILRHGGWDYLQTIRTGELLNNLNKDVLNIHSYAGSRPIRDYFRHYSQEKESISGTIGLYPFKRFMQAAEGSETLRSFPLGSYIFPSIRPSIQEGGYSRLGFSFA